MEEILLNKIIQTKDINNKAKDNRIDKIHNQGIHLNFINNKRISNRNNIPNSKGINNKEIIVAKCNHRIIKIQTIINNNNNKISIKINIRIQIRIKDKVIRMIIKMNFKPKEILVKIIVIIVIEEITIEINLREGKINSIKREGIIKIRIIMKEEIINIVEAIHQINTIIIDIIAEKKEINMILIKKDNNNNIIRKKIVAEKMENYQTIITRKRIESIAKGIITIKIMTTTTIIMKF